MSNIKNKKNIQRIKEMLKIIPNGITVCLEDLEEIYSQEFSNRKDERVNQFTPTTPSKKK